MSKAKSAGPELVVVGSIGIDTIETPAARRESILGGSVSYACAAASFFTSVGMVGVVGDDFPAPYKGLFESFGIDLAGLQTVPGKTFRWSGVYERDMNSRRTLSTDLNVFADFSPRLPAAYRDCPFLMLGNISPGLQLHVLDQARKPRFVMADTMDLWINIALEDLKKVIARVHLLTLNDSEAKALTGCGNLMAAARCVRELGPRYVIIKKGEHGAMLFDDAGVFIVPAYPLESVADPTGAGDTFAGALMGSLARDGDVTEETLRHAMLYGSTVASFGVEEFSLDRLRRLTEDGIETRAAELADMMRLELD